MVSTPWLSVVIPVYLAEANIEQAIASVVRQGVDGVEIICVDDQSPDASAEVISAITRTNDSVILLHHDTNQGPGGARNTGINAATGDYIAFLDADDLLADGAIRSLRDTVNASVVDLVLVGCEALRRGKIRSLTDSPLTVALAKQSAGVSVAMDPRVLFWPPAPWSKVYRREFLTTHDFRFGSGVAQDIPWSASVTLHAERIVLSPGVFYRYVTRERGSSITTTKSDKNLIRLAQVRAIREKNELEGFSESVLSHLTALAAIHLIWSNRAAYRLLPDSSHKDFFHDSAQELAIWRGIAQAPPWLDSRPLMSAFDRNAYSRALASGDWANWQATLLRHTRLRNFRRVFRPGRVVGKKP